MLATVRTEVSVYINEVLVDSVSYYRIKNNFPDSGDNFWYNIHSNGEELNSHCQSRDQAQVYRGAEIIYYADAIKGHSNVVLIKV